VSSPAGVIQPMKEIGELCRSRKVFFHTDAAQVIPYPPSPWKCGWRMD